MLRGGPPLGPLLVFLLFHELDVLGTGDLAVGDTLLLGIRGKLVLPEAHVGDQNERPTVGVTVKDRVRIETAAAAAEFLAAATKLPLQGGRQKEDGSAA